MAIKVEYVMGSELNTSGTSWTGGTVTNTNNNYCPFRLPCGICQKTNLQCPIVNNWEITWDINKVTCSTGCLERK